MRPHVSRNNGNLFVTHCIMSQQGSGVMTGHASGLLKGSEVAEGE